MWALDVKAGTGLWASVSIFEENFGSLFRVNYWVLNEWPTKSEQPYPFTRIIRFQYAEVLVILRHGNN